MLAGGDGATSAVGNAGVDIAAAAGGDGSLKSRMARLGAVVADSGVADPSELLSHGRQKDLRAMEVGDGAAAAAGAAEGASDDEDEEMAEAGGGEAVSAGAPAVGGGGPNFHIINDIRFFTDFDDVKDVDAGIATVPGMEQ